MATFKRTLMLVNTVIHTVLPKTFNVTVLFIMTTGAFSFMLFMHTSCKSDSTADSCSSIAVLYAFVLSFVTTLPLYFRINLCLYVAMIGSKKNEKNHVNA